METNEETEVLDFTKPDYIFVPKGSHDWRQMGPYIVCKSCDLEHAVYVGVKKQMVGINEQGQPILKKL
jgi:hypothetical protein